MLCPLREFFLPDYYSLGSLNFSCFFFSLSRLSLLTSKLNINSSCVCVIINKRFLLLFFKLFVFASYFRTLAVILFQIIYLFVFKFIALALFSDSLRSLSRCGSEWVILAFHSAFWTFTEVVYLYTALFDYYMAGVSRNWCHLGVSSVYIIQPYLHRCVLKPHT